MPPKTQTRSHKARAAQPEQTPAAPPAQPDRREAVMAALAADAGPLALTVAVNRITQKVQVMDNCANLADMGELVGILGQVRDQLQARLFAAQAAQRQAQADASPPAPDVTP